MRSGASSVVLTQPRPTVPPVLDTAQAGVVAHRGGPLLVLAGPGTGKTTTLVETMVARLQGPDALRADHVLGLTFGRQAAAQWCERVTARLGGGLVPKVATFHSIAYAIVRADRSARGITTPLRLLSAAEQEYRIRELLAGSRIEWPSGFASALSTRTFSSALRELLARVRTAALEPNEFAQLARSVGGQWTDVWAASAQFLQEYLEVLDLADVIDYTEVIHQAAVIVDRDDEIRSRYRCILVDEYQDTDPGQIRLLRALVGPGADIVAVGDPDQAVYEFRGADSRGILHFPNDFPTADGSPAPIIVLNTCRRSGPVLRAAATRLVGSSALAPLPADVQRRHRDVAPVDMTGDFDVRVFDTAADEASHVAAWLRQRHHDDGLPYDQMAVLVRNGRGVPRLRRALTAAGVPVEVSADEIPLAQEPVLAPLLLLLRLVTRPGDPLAALDPTGLLTLACSPLGGADPTELRALGRTLRSMHRRATPESPAPRSDELLHARLRALLDDITLNAVTSPATAQAADEALRRLAHTIGATAQAAAAGSVADMLWAAWSSTETGTGWPARLRAAALRPGVGAADANADLDAIVALFAAAERADQRVQGRLGLMAFLDEIHGQHIPADSLAQRGVRGAAVQLLTAHRAKGSEWEAVAVVGVEESTWPDLRQPASALGVPALARILGRDDPPSPLTQERRLCYVACTRARTHLLMTAVDSATEEGSAASRFLTDVLGEMPTRGPGARTATTPSALVAELRRVILDDSETQARRIAAARRLSRLAVLRDHGGRSVQPAADPETWWGVAQRTSSMVPVRPGGEAVALSGSQISALQTCPLRWLLEREVRASATSSPAMGVGSLLHVLADAVSRGELPADPGVLESYLDQVWSGLQFATEWQSRVDRRAASVAIGHLLDRVRTTADSEVASEQGFDLTVGSGSNVARLRGRIDRIERTAEGEVTVVDFKTGKTMPTKDDVQHDLQLGVYQLAVRSGLFGDEAPAWLRDENREPMGAELLFLRSGKLIVQDALAAREFVDDAIAQSVQTIRTEEFVALRGEHCRTCPARAACPALDEGRAVL